MPLSVEPMAANMDGYFSPDRQRIAIREGMSEVQTVSAAVHEIAHSKLHNYAKAQEEAARAGDKEPPKKKDRNTEEVEAESISTRFASITVSRRARTASATSPTGARVRICRSCGQFGNHQQGGRGTDRGH